MRKFIMTSQYICLCLALITRSVITGSLGGDNTVLSYPGGIAPPSTVQGDGVPQGVKITPVNTPHRQEITQQKIIRHSSEHGAYTHDYKVLADAPQICNGPVFLLVFVCSSIENAAQRQAIRETWGSIDDDQVKVVFMLGDVAENNTKKTEIRQSVRNESAHYSDIVQEDFIDSYKNLTIKSIGWIKWTAFRCKRARYILKTDDDMFINLPSLLTDLRNTVHKRFIMGNIIAGAQPMHDKDSKYYTPESDYDKALYPKYMSGSAYVISGDLIYDLYKATQRTAPFWIEDIYITGLLAEKLDMQHIFNGKFGYKRRILHPCLFKHVITMHYVTPPEMVKLWQKMLNVPYPCERTRLSHGNMDGT